MLARIDWTAVSAVAAALAAGFAAVAAGLSRRDVRNQVKLFKLHALGDLLALLIEAKAIEVVPGGTIETARMFSQQDRLRGAVALLALDLPKTTALVAHQLDHRPSWDSRVKEAIAEVQEEIRKAKRPR